MRFTYPSVVTGHQSNHRGGFSREIQELESNPHREGGREKGAQNFNEAECTEEECQ
jgi:hypothetical protein